MFSFLLFFLFIYVFLMFSNCYKKYVFLLFTIPFRFGHPISRHYFALIFTMSFLEFFLLGIVGIVWLAVITPSNVNIQSDPNCFYKCPVTSRLLYHPQNGRGMLSDEWWPLTHISFCTIVPPFFIVIGFSFDFKTKWEKSHFLYK